MKQRIDTFQHPKWLIPVRVLLTAVAVGILGWEGIKTLLTSGFLENDLRVGLFLALVIWIMPLYRMIFQPRYFVEWDETAVSWCLPEMKKPLTFRREQLSNVHYKPFTLSFDADGLKRELDLAPFREQEVKTIREAFGV